MEHVQQDSSSTNIYSINVDKIKPIAEIYPYIETHRIVFNEKYTELYEKYDALGMEIPKSEDVEKYIKIPYSLHGRAGFSFTQDMENDHWTLVEFQEIEHLLDISYKDLTNAVLKTYGITFNEA